MPAYKDEKTGKWYCQFYYEDWQGKKRHKVKRGFDRKKDADKWETDFKANASMEVLTMSKLIDEYKKHLDNRVDIGTLKRSTLYQTKNKIDHKIAPYFGDIDVTKIKTKDINDFLVSISGRPGTTDRPNPSYVTTIKNTLRQIFKYAMHNYGLKENPVENAEMVKYVFESRDKRVKMLPIEDYQKLCAAIKKPEYILALDLMYWAGLRIGEVFALTPADISPYCVSVTKTLSYGNGSTFTDTTKTKSSTRVTEIPKFLYYKLMDYTSRMYDTSVPIFNFTTSALREHIARKTKKMGLPRISPHTLRHSYASNLFNVTKDATVVSRQLGHANPNITLSIYSHMLPGENRKAVDNLEEHFKPTKTIEIETGK